MCMKAVFVSQNVKGVRLLIIYLLSVSFAQHYCPLQLKYCHFPNSSTVRKQY